MASRYSVHNKPPYFQSLNEARAYAISLDEHEKYDDIPDSMEWGDSVYRGDDLAGLVMKAKDTDSYAGFGTYFRWVYTEKDGTVTVVPLYGDGTLVDIPKNVVAAPTEPIPGGYGLGNADQTIWFKSLKEALKQGYIATKESEDGFLGQGYLSVAYEIRDEFCEKCGYIIQRSEGDILYGSADNGWFQLRPNGNLGKKVRVIGGPYLSGDADTMENMDMPEDLMELWEDIHQKLRIMLSPEEYETLCRDFGLEEMKDRSPEERVEDINKIMQRVIAAQKGNNLRNRRI